MSLVYRPSIKFVIMVLTPRFPEEEEIYCSSRTWNEIPWCLDEFSSQTLFNLSNPRLATLAPQHATDGHATNPIKTAIRKGTKDLAGPAPLLSKSPKLLENKTNDMTIKVICNTPLIAKTVV